MGTLFGMPFGPETVPAGAGGGAATQLAWNETPAGVVDGVNPTFTVAQTPNPAISLSLHVNGVLQQQGAANDFTLSGSTITFQPGAIPQSGDVVLATYEF